MSTSIDEQGRGWTAAYEISFYADEAIDMLRRSAILCASIKTG
ncbi:hypothetical protein [Lysobacter brunescens]|uniref:Uncharacterized protein n=1 Tax=Lysobacter brunescens TaxID=262323 RepID=A0ABW2Y9Y2_9GAMM